MQELSNLQGNNFKCDPDRYETYWRNTTDEHSGLSWLGCVLLQELNLPTDHNLSNLVFHLILLLWIGPNNPRSIPRFTAFLWTPKARHSKPEQLLDTLPFITARNTEENLYFFSPTWCLMPWAAALCGPSTRSSGARHGRHGSLHIAQRSPLLLCDWTLAFTATNLWNDVESSVIAFVGAAWVKCIRQCFSQPKHQNPQATTTNQSPDVVIRSFKPDSSTDLNTQLCFERGEGV